MAASETPSGKLDFKSPDISFAGEGDPEWLGRQLDKVLAAIKDQRTPAPPKPPK